jgi:GNAT superfamily N-acetyltransferase
MGPVVIRRADISDAAGAVAVVRRSITSLCVGDHQGEPATLSAWLANKTPARFEQLIGRADRLCLVASINDEVVGFAAMSLAGEIGLLYVSPEVRFHGVSASLLAALEQEACGLGLNELSLSSTGTARRFYMERGFTECGDPRPGFSQTTIYPLRKALL